MTLEEAKKKIRNYMKQSKDDYNRFEDDICRGEADAYSHALSILEQVDAEPVVKDKLTLTELARELRKSFRFKYLTVDKDSCHYPHPVIEIWDVYPEYKEIPTVKDEYWNPSQETRCWDHGNYVYSGKFCLHSLTAELDLSEYADENGEIDYSRCIVEVSDDAE